MRGKTQLKKRYRIEKQSGNHQNAASVRLSFFEWKQSVQAV
jgi:hypothetical protein